MSARRLEELYASLQSQLSAELAASRAANTNAEAKGDVSEATWLELFKRHLPHRYRAVKGFVIDCNGDESDAIDIIIHDRQYTPIIYSQRGAPYIPAESVYAVLEAKQELDKGLIEYAGDKAASVRKLHRTTAAIPHAGGTYAAKEPFPILAGIVAYESGWNPSFGDAFQQCVRSLDTANRLDIGIASARGAFEVDYPMGKAKIQTYDQGRALAAFLIRLLARLQTLGTVPAINYDVYGRLLSSEPPG